MIKKVMEIKPCKNNIGAEICIDLQKISNENIQSIKKALNEYGVIFFRKQNLSPSKYIKFAENFGELADYPMKNFQKLQSLRENHQIKDQVLVNNFIRTLVILLALQDSRC